MKSQHWVVHTHDTVADVWIPVAQEFSNAEAAWNWARVNCQEGQFYIVMVEREEK